MKLFLNAKQSYEPFRKIVEYKVKKIRKRQTFKLEQVIYEDLQVRFDDVIERIGVKRI